jgi:deoxyribodipyrimidine photo-lyase
VGEISPRSIWAAARRHLDDPALSAPAEKFTAELIWRDFAWHLLAAYPTLPTRAWRPAFAAFPYRRDAHDEAAWTRAITGEPLVDAGLRELFVTGRMHNRVRMAVASYLVKHLLIDWRVGLAWFADTLTDWDPASNAMNWQWVAGSGPDAAPFFRIFNPATQAARFDPNGTYRRRWLWDWQGSTSPDAGDYFEAVPRFWGLDPDDPYPPAPVVDLQAGRARALAALARMKQAQPDPDGAAGPPP